MRWRGKHVCGLSRVSKQVAHAEETALRADAERLARETVDEAKRALRDERDALRREVPLGDRF